MTSKTVSYDLDQNSVVDETRGNLLTDVQMSAEATPMKSTTTIMALNDRTTHDIRTILERPVNLGTFAWSSTDTVIPIQLSYALYSSAGGISLQEWNFPQDLFANSINLVDKLQKYQYLKADIEIEIKVNAQPFLQGALMMVYNPYYALTNKFRRDGVRFLASATSCPHKILSLEEGNSMKLICPYANIYDLFDLSNTDNQFGTVQLYVFSPLKGSEPTSVKYTVFARLVNPQFYVPTHKENNTVLLDQRARQRLVKSGVRFAESDTKPSACRDSGETHARGPISRIAKGVSMIGDVLSSVPVIGNIAASVAWVSRIIGNTALAFGYSKPVTTNTVALRAIKPNQTLIHTEGQDNASTLALLQDNGIDGSSFIPEISDEMALSHIFSRPNFFHSVTVDTAQFSGNKLLTAWEVSPFSAYQYGDSDDPQTLFLGSFAYTSICMGTLWRGTINYDINVIKTSFHQGRFAVVFLPETTISEIPATLGELLTTNYNVVCNLKDRQDEMGRVTFRISVPFISNTNWRETYKVDPKTRELNATTLDTMTGCLAIYSLVDLSHPPTVSNEVSFFVAHSGGDDYTISRPVLNLAPGYPARYAQSDVGPVMIPRDENLLVPQHTSADVTAQTTGEYFVSLRSFIKRFGKLAKLDPSPNFLSLKQFHFDEERDGPRSASLYGGIGKAPLYPNPFYMVSFLYRFYNGSVSHKIIPNNLGAKGEAYLSFSESLDGIAPTSEISDIGQPLFEQLQIVSSCFETRTPFYRGVRGDVVGSTQAPVLGAPRTNLRFNSAASDVANIYEAAGDDFSFYFLIGPPPMCDISYTLEPVPINNVESFLIDFTTATTLDVQPTYIQFSPIGGPPASLQIGNPTPIYNAAGTSIETVTLRYPSSVSKTLTYNKMAIIQTTLNNFALRVYVADRGDLDTTTTLAAFKAKADASIQFLIQPDRK